MYFYPPEPDTLCQIQMKHPVQYSSIFFSIKPKLDMQLFVDIYVFTRFWLNLSDQNLKLFWTSKQNNFRFRSSKFSQKLVKTQKSTNNIMSSFGVIEKIWSCLIFIKLYMYVQKKNINFKGKGKKHLIINYEKGFLQKVQIRLRRTRPLEEACLETVSRLELPFQQNWTTVNR